MKCYAQKNPLDSLNRRVTIEIPRNVRHVEIESSTHGSLNQRAILCLQTQSSMPTISKTVATRTIVLVVPMSWAEFSIVGTDSDELRLRTKSGRSDRRKTSQDVFEVAGGERH